MSSNRQKENEVIVVEPGDVPAEKNIYDLGPQRLVSRASEIAKALKPVIEQNNLCVTIQGSKHVTCEGWTTLGAMLGVYSQEKEVIAHDDGTFEAHVELISAKTGEVVGRGSAVCGIDEPRWAKMPKYARRSMAITRAIVRAFKNTFSWIIKLSGYDPTPFEEVDDGVNFAKATSSKKKKKKSDDYEKLIELSGKIEDEDKRAAVQESIERYADNPSVLAQFERRITNILEEQ